MQFMTIHKRNRYNAREPKAFREKNVLHTYYFECEFKAFSFWNLFPLIKATQVGIRKKKS